MTLNQALLDDVQSVLDGQAFLVGGAVRDHVMGREVDDFDFCTPLSPDEVEDAVRRAGKRPFLTGKRFGTVAFKSNGEKVEVTTFRHEVFVPGSRKPEVEFVTDLFADLARRDFTFNAMALDANGVLHDPFGGTRDVEMGVVRGVGNVSDRFTDDPLRMVRAVRFESQLGFVMSDETFRALREQSSQVHTVARERWTQEFDKLLMGSHVDFALESACATGLMRMMFPEMGSRGMFGGVDQFTADTSLDERWRLFLRSLVDVVGLDLPTGDAVRKVVLQGMALRLKFSNERRAVVTS